MGNKIDIKDENIKNVSENIQNEFADSINVDNREIGLKNLEFLDSAKNYSIDTETETFKLLEGFISKRGIKAQFNDKAFTNNNTNGLWGVSKNGKRFVLFNPNSTTEQRVEATIVHETFHDIVSQGHGQDIINMVMKNASTKEDFQKAYNNLKKTYENAGYNIKDKVYFENLIKEEATASILGQKLGNEEFISETLKNKTVFDKIYSIVVSISNLFNGLTGYKNEKLMWQDIKNKYTKYYNQKGNIVYSDVKFSKAKLNNGADVVISDEVLGINPRINEVKEHLEKMIGKEYFNASSKKIIGIEKTDINKYIHDGYNNYKNTKLKKRIVGNYGEILELSKISSNKPNEKGTNRGVDGFDYYKCYLAYPIRGNSQNIVNYKVYSGRLVVRKEPNGNFAYDLDNFSYKKGLTVDKTSLSIYTGQSPEISKSSYENNLQQKDEIVNNVMKSVTSKNVQEVADLKNREIAKKNLTEEDEDKLGKALYILNKKAKEGRDLSQYLYEKRKKVNFKDAPVFLKDELEKRGYKADDDGNITFFDEYGKKYTTKNEIDEAIDENQRNIADLEYWLENDGEEYDEEQIAKFEEDLEFYKEYEEDLENVKEKIENLKDDISDIDLDYYERQKSLYHLKEEVLKNYEPLGYHYFPGKVWYDEEGGEHGGEDPYAYYKIGKWSFHNKVNDRKKLYGLKEIGSIGDQISSENKVDDMTYDEAKEIVINYLKADTKLSKKSPTWQEFLDKNYPSTGKGKTMKEIRESALVNFGNNLDSYNEKEISNWNSSKRIKLANSEKDVINFVRNSLNNSTSNLKLYYGKIKKEVANKIKSTLGLDIDRYNLSLSEENIRHISKNHMNENEYLRGQEPIVERDFLKIPQIVNEYDKIERGYDTKENKATIRFEKEFDNNYYVVSYVSDKHHDLKIQTMYKMAQKKNSHTENNDINIPVHNVANNSTNRDMSSYENNISKSNEKVNLNANKTNNDLVLDEKGNLIPNRPKILEEVPKKNEKTTLKEKFLNFRYNVTDKGAVIYDIAKKTKNKNLYHTYDRIGVARNEAQNQIGKVQTNLNGVEYKNFTDKQGNKVSMSLDSMWEEAKTENIPMETLNKYLVNQLNLDRLNQNIEQFGDLTAYESEEIIKDIETNHPDIKRIAENIWQYNKNQLDRMVEAGLISKETQEYFETNTPHYVRIQRDIQKGNTLSFSNGRVKINNQIKKVKGGIQDILPLKESQAQYTIDITKAIRNNEFGKELSKIVEADTYEGINTSLDSDLELQGNFVNIDEDGNYTLTYYEDGKPKMIPINEDIYKSLSTSDSIPFEKEMRKTFGKISQIQRSLLTDKNPYFLVSNFFKDIGDAPFNSKYGVLGFMPGYMKAIKQQYKKGNYFKLYENLGGKASSYFQDGTFINNKDNKINKAINKVLTPIEKANDFIEQLPRLNEFIRTIM